MKLAARIKRIEFESAPDSCTDREEEPTMTVEFLNAGGGNFVRIKSAYLLPMNTEDLVPFSDFLQWVCEQNDKILKEEGLL